MKLVRHNRAITVWREILHIKLCHNGVWCPIKCFGSFVIYQQLNRSPWPRQFKKKGNGMNITMYKVSRNQLLLVTAIYMAEVMSVDFEDWVWHYNDVIISAMASQIISLTIIYSTVDSGADQRKHQSSASLAFVRGIQRWPMKSPHKGPVTRKLFPFDDVIMLCRDLHRHGHMVYKHTGTYGKICKKAQSMRKHACFWQNWHSKEKMIGVYWLCYFKK